MFVFRCLPRQLTSWICSCYIYPDRI